MFENLDSIAAISVPEKCRGCGTQCESAAQLVGLLLIKHLGNTVGESLVGEDGREFDAMIEETFPEEIADDVKKNIRHHVGEGLTEIDEQIDKVQQEIKANNLSCSGTLKMRASRGDVSYTVSVCTSARIYKRDAASPEHVPVHVKAESTYKQN